MRDLEKKVFLVLNENKNGKNKSKNSSFYDSQKEIEKYV
jgi:hypothetical protein